jgi:AraC-like DNA-binding protein
MTRTDTTASAAQARMVELLLRLAPSEGYTQSLLDDVTLMRSDRPLNCTQALYEPSIVIIVQGRKHGLHGGQRYVYDARHYLVLSVPLPFSTETEASEEEPMLGLALRIDPTATAELAMSIDDESPRPAPQPATMYATRLDAKLEDAALRLLEALDRPLEARLLGPSIIREITYRVLTGEQGGGLRSALLHGGAFGRIARVLRRIHTHYARELDIHTLALEANMSTPAFHAHFKAVTQTSPIQYIKAIRLHQARLMMIRNGMNAQTASTRVGYESPSQFSREFKRMFGRSPQEEARHLKQLLSLTSPVTRPAAVDGRSGTRQ